MKKPKTKNNGGNTDYYKLKSAPFKIKDADDFMEWRRLNTFQGNILKVAWTFNVGRHSGTDAIRDINKVLHYAKREKKRLLRLQESEKIKQQERDKIVYKIYKIKTKSEV